MALSSSYTQRRPTTRRFDFLAAFNIPAEATRRLTEGLISTPIQTITRTTGNLEGKVKVEEVVYLGSYSWTDEHQPTIIVPGNPTTSSRIVFLKLVLTRQPKSIGSPGIWVDKPIPLAVPGDTGTNYVDQNGHRVPSSTLLPLFRAVDVVAESKVESNINWSSVDFVTDRNGLRKLFRWANYNGTNPQLKDFRIDMQLAGERTVLLNRWEPFTTVKANSRSFGYSFERVCTVPEIECEEATGHHRIVKYVSNFKR